MSLINDMLHDLEKRRSHEKQEVPAYEVPIVTRVASTGGKILLWLGGIAVAAGLTWAAIFFIPQFMTQPAESAGVVEPELAKKEPVQVAEEEQSLQRHVEPSIPMEKDHEVSPAPVDQTEVKAAKQLNRLLPGGGVHEDDNIAKLTLLFSQAPEYQLIQSGDQDNPFILEFRDMQLAGDFEMPAAESAIVKNVKLQKRAERIQLLVRLAENTRLERLAIDQKEQPSQGQVFLFSADFLQKVQPDEIVRISANSPLKKLAGTAQVSPQQHQPNDKTLKDQELSEEKHSSLTKKDNQLSIDRQAYADGIRRFRQGDLQSATLSFRKALEVNPALIEARLQLIDVLLRQGRQSLAAEEARQGLVSAPENGMLRKKYVRFLFDDQRYAEAIELLQKPPVPKVSKDQEYHALLAATLREAGQFHAASKVYAGLLQVRPNESLWWLGLAVSMDQIGERDQARRAYRQALALPGLAPQLQSYVQSRLEVL